MGATWCSRARFGTNAEHDEAARAAWSAAGVYTVDNQIKVKGFWDFED